LNNGDHAEVAKDMDCCSFNCKGCHGFLSDPEDSEYDFKLAFTTPVGSRTTCIFKDEELKLWEDHI